MRARWLAPVGVLLALITWHADSLRPSVGLDHSWQIALSLAAARGLDFGHDVVFTYGPLGFLSVPVLVSTAAAVAGWIYSLLVQVALAVVVYAAGARLFGRAAGVLVAFAALGLTLLVSDALSFLALFAVVWALERDDPPGSRWLVPAAGAVAAFELLVKLNGGVLCLVLFALAAWRLGPRGWRSELLLLASFAASLVVLWVATRNSLSALPTWLKESRHVVGSYTGAMATAGQGRTAETVVATLLVVGGAVLVALQVRALPRARAICLALAAGAFTYAYLKEGFVRYDAHALQFFGAFALLGLAFAWRGLLRWGALALVAGCVVGVAVAPDGVLYPVASNVRHLASIGDTDLGAARVAAQTALGVPAGQLALVRGRSVDAVPYETSAVWAYRLHWQPEPLLQWYMAYDAQLDGYNAARLRAERVLVQRTTSATDAKAVAFEAPATYLSLLCNYRELAANASWETLARADDSCGEQRELATVPAAANEIVHVPAAKPDELVVAHVHLGGSQLLATLAKPRSFPRVTVGGNTYRIVPATATGPLVLREPASAGRSPFFGGWTSDDTLSLSRAATIEFDAIPIRRTPVALQPSSPPDGMLAGGSIRVGTTSYTVTPGAFAGYVDLARPAGGVGAVAGWAVGATGIAVFDGSRLVAVARPREGRQDIYGIYGVANAGWSALFPLAGAPARVRVFAFGSGKATELPLPPGYPWP